VENVLVLSWSFISMSMGLSLEMQSLGLDLVDLSLDYITANFLAIDSRVSIL